MSAYMVDKATIDALVTAAVNLRLIGSTVADVTGDMLVKENLRSIHTRYPDSVTDPKHTPGPRKQYWQKPYRLERYSEVRDPVVLLKACNCYDYQACETDDYYETPAGKFIAKLRNYLIDALPGYDDAPWGIEGD